MWQLFALGSIIGTAGENVVDKIAIVGNKRVDSLVATFWRLCFFFICTLVIGLFGWLGGVQFIFAPLIFLVALAGIGNSLLYTYILRRIEVTGIAAVTYLSPFLFLFIDERVLHTALSGGEIAGIFLMVLGGFSFAIDGKTHHFKKEYSMLVWFMLFFMVFYTGVDAYSFKYLHEVYGTSPVSFTLSYGILMCVGLFFVVLVAGKRHLLWTKPARNYLPWIAISKSFDAAESVLWAQALTLAAVSQVSAMQALEPIALFAVTILAQDILRLRAGEKLDRSRTRWKAIAISMLVIGGLLVN